MFVLIARKELIEITRDGRFRGAAAIVLGLLLVALGAGWTHYRDVSAQHRSAQELTRRHWLSQPAKDPHSAAHYGIYAFKPRQPLSLVDTGVDHYTGVAAWLEAHKQNEFQFRPAQDRTVIVRFGELTAATTLQFLLPILVLLLAAETFAGEREQGTLRQVLSLGVAPRTLAMGKLAGVAAALALVVVPAAVVGASALVLASPQLRAQDLLTRPVTLAAVYVVYFGVIASVSIAVSARAGSVRRALAVSICFWAANALVAPRVASEVGKWLHPTPTAFEFAQDVRRATYDGLDVHEYNIRRARELKGRLLRDYDVRQVEDLPVNFRGIDYLEREEHANRTFDEQYGELWRAFDDQIAVHQRAGLLAPLLAARSLSMAIAGTDFFHHRHFAQTAEAYRRRLVRAMNEDLAYHSSSGRLGYTAGPELWQACRPSSIEPLRCDGHSRSSDGVCSPWACGRCWVYSAWPGRSQRCGSTEGAMMLFWRIIRHEWRTLTRDRAFWILAALLVLLIVGAVHNGSSWVRAQRTTVEAIRLHDERLFSRLGAEVRALEQRRRAPEGLPLAGMAWYLLHDDKEPPPAPHLDPRRPEAAGSEWVAARYAILPPEPLGALSIGQGDLYPYYARVTIRMKPALLNNDEIENPVTLLNGRFDLAFVLVFCWPLVALPLFYDLVSRERDDRTLLLALAQPVSLQTLVHAKLIVRGGALVVLTLATGGLALAASGSLNGEDVFIRMALWGLLVVANATLWLGVSLLVNAANWRSALNAVALAGIWLGWVLVVPSIVNVLVTAWSPVPSRVELLSEMREATNAASGDVARLVAHYYEEHLELAPPETTPDRIAVRSVALQEEAERGVQPIVDAFDARVSEQRELAHRFRYLSPAILLQDAMNELAGTTSGRYQRFMTQLEAHHKAWRDFFYPRIYQRATLTAADYDRMPRFEFRPEPLRVVAARAGTSIGIVLLTGVVLLASALRALRWYSVAG